MHLKNEKTKERIGIVLLVLILLISGLVLIKDDPKPIKYNGVDQESLEKQDIVPIRSDASKNSTTTEVPKGKININTASLEDLDTLPGIGEKTAQKIIDYRNSHGLFKTAEGIKDVPGIGEAKYSSIKDLIAI